MRGWQKKTKSVFVSALFDFLVQMADFVVAGFKRLLSWRTRSKEISGSNRRLSKLKLDKLGKSESDDEVIQSIPPRPPISFQQELQIRKKYLKSVNKDPDQEEAKRKALIKDRVLTNARVVRASQY